MSVINSQPLIGASGNQGGAYNIERSLRFRSSASGHLSRTPSTAGNRRTWTYSAWIKRGELGRTQAVWFSGDNGTDTYGLLFDSSNVLQVGRFSSGWTWLLQTTQVFRDVSAWYHIAVSIDTTQATAANRVKIYVNGTQVTSFSTANYPSQNFDTEVNSTSFIHRVGFQTSSNAFSFDGYLAEINFVDGQQLDASSFGETDTITGVWKPKRYAGTYGTNGFYLKFNTLTSTATLGNDSSGNGNTWTVNNVSLTAGENYDSMTDVPTLTSATAANYATLNPLFTNTGASNTYFQGNLQLASASSSVNSFSPSTISMTSGKYYFEVKAGRVNGATGMTAGVFKLPISHGTNFFAQPNFRYYSVDGKVYNETTSVQNYSTYTDNDVIGVALDLTNGRVFFAKNGTWQGSSDPAAGTNPAASGLSGEWVFGLNVGNTLNDWAFANFGQRPFTYTPPSGFVALNTFNLPASTIVAGNKVMDATTWTGNGSNPRTITNSGGFYPDLVWGKIRSQAYNHQFYDSVRGTGKSIASNTTGQTITNETDGFITAFNSDGFTAGAGGSGNNYWNQNSQTYVAWQWKAGTGSSSSNTAGSITSTVSTNASAGFSVVQYVGTGANATVGHGLGVAPKWIIVKSLTRTDNWIVYHSGMTSAANYMYLNLTNAQAAGSTVWNSTAPTSTVFSLGNDTTANSNGATQIAYCWSEIEGFSKFGSYTGNGSADGVFVYTGFRPKFVLIKRTDSADDWVLMDTARNTFNVISNELYPNLSSAEGTGYSSIDYLSNGFKLRATGTRFNANGGTYIYMAFAENPTKFALAR